MRPIAPSLPLLPHSSLSYEQTAQGVAERLRLGDPLGAWEWAVGCGRWRVFLTEASGRSGSGLLAPSRGWGGEAGAWRSAGERCARQCVEVFGESSSELDRFFTAPRLEFFEGAARVVSEKAWLERVKEQARRVDFGAMSVRSLRWPLLSLGPGFQLELMRLDWEGGRELPWAQTRQRREVVAPSGLCALAELPSAEPLRRAAEFLSERGVFWAEGVERPSCLGGPLAMAVGALSEPCARLALQAQPGASAERDTEATLAFWRSGVDSLLSPDPQALFERRLAFASRLDLERELCGPARKGRAAGL